MKTAIITVGLMAAATLAAAPAQESCDPPFVVDAAGVRHYKRACIR